MSELTRAADLARLNRQLDAELPTADEPLCDRCEASFRETGDTLCAACRADIDMTFADLPGAEP